jgi:hypothetical protein
MTNISELTNEQLNRLMIWLYPERASEYRKESDYTYQHKIKEHNGEYYYESKEYEVADLYLDFVEDWNLTMPLAVENNLGVQFHSPVVVFNFGMDIENNHKNPLRAICEVLVMIKLENNK